MSKLIRFSNGYDWRKYQDSQGLIHLVENPPLDQSENPILFTAVSALFADIDYRSTAIESPAGDNMFRANAAREYGSHFSHDNMTGLYCYKILTGRSIKHLPILKWNKEYWLHPRDIIFYLYCHNKYLALPFLWISSLAMIVSCFQRYKYRNGRRIIKTDGKILAFLRCNTMKMNLTLKICTWAIENHDYFNNWYDVAKMYYKEHHPITKAFKYADDYIK